MHPLEQLDAVVLVPKVGGRMSRRGTFNRKTGKTTPRTKPRTHWANARSRSRGKQR